MIVVRFLALACPLFLAFYAQAAPQFAWQGQVHGVAILRLQGRNVVVQTKNGALVENQKFHFFDRLPETQQMVRLDVLEGRGYVHVIDQPSIENHYTVGVLIEDRQQGSSIYSIALYWDTSDNPVEEPGKTEHVTWTGRVDQDAIISCQKRSCVSRVQQGAPVTEEHYKFTRPLPAHDSDVRLEDPDGRGEIHLIEQPRERNHYTARVSIRDPQAGSGEYSFTLVWDRVPKQEGSPLPEPSGRGLIWSGVVQGRVRVTIEGGATFSEALNGGSVSAEHTDLLRPLPQRTGLMPAIQKLSGRGRASIIESPSEKNHWQLVFEVDDPGPGAGNYEIELDW